MLTRLISDAHLEFIFDVSESSNGSARKAHFNKILPDLPNDKETILIVNGDLASISKKERIKMFFNMASPRFRHIIYVLGNHEFYHGDIDTTEFALVDLLAEFKNVTVAGNTPQKIVIDNVAFLAGTLWTDYAKKTYDVDNIRNYIACSINDHIVIKKMDNGIKRSFHPDDGAVIHRQMVDFLEHEMTYMSNDMTVVVCTHHLPSPSCVSPQYTITATDRMLNHAFASNLDWLIEKYKPKYWLFGHTHNPFNFKLYETQMVCNPVGYPKESNIDRSKYNPTLVLDV